MITHKKEFGVYHWDTFDNATILISEHDSLEDAQEKVRSKYGDRIRSNGADVVDIVNQKGDVELTLLVSIQEEFAVASDLCEKKGLVNAAGLLRRYCVDTIKP